MKTTTIHTKYGDQLLFKTEGDWLSDCLVMFGDPMMVHIGHWDDDKMPDPKRLTFGQLAEIVAVATHAKTDGSITRVDKIATDTPQKGDVYVTIPSNLTVSIDVNHGEEAD